jgi:hypothetical protein
VLSICSKPVIHSLFHFQDYNYLHTNCFEITLELGCVKYPYQKDLLRYWNENRVAIFAFIEEAHRGMFFTCEIVRLSSNVSSSNSQNQA